MNNGIKVIIKDVGINDAFFPDRKLLIGKVGYATDVLMIGNGYYGFYFVPTEPIVINSQPRENLQFFNVKIEIIDWKHKKGICHV